MSFSKRKIEVTITLGSGQFGDGLGDTKTMKDHRVIVDLHTPGGAQQGALYCQIYGLSLSEMNLLTQIGPYSNVVRTGNRISIAAGDEGSALTQCYQGTIKNAVGDYASPPDSYLEVWALSAAGTAVVPVGANSFPGPTAVDSIMSALAAQATPPLVYVNDGVSAQLANPYFTGTVLTQIQQCAKAANINYTIHNGVLTIWPKGQTVTQDSVPIISAATGMVGYPKCTANGLEVMCLYNPNLRVGALTQVQSQIQIANGNWTTVDLRHRLESEKPGGAWFSYFRGVHPNGNY